MTSRTTPAYKILARDLRTAILKGDYPAGMQLPTEAELVAEYSVSRQTVRRAFQDLVSEGIVDRTAGRGTFVSPNSANHLRQFMSLDDLMAISTDSDLEVLTPLKRRVDIEGAGRLGLDSDSVETVEFVRREDQIPFLVQRIRLPPDIASCLSDVVELRTTGATMGTTVINLLDARLPEPIAEAEQSITACAATDGVASILECDPGSPILCIDRIYRTVTGRPVEIATGYFHADRYSYRIRLRRNFPGLTP